MEKEKKEKPKRKLPRKSQRAKRRYVLFSLKNYPPPKHVFDLIMGQFSPDERKAFGTWFIEFNPKTGRGIVRCKLGFEAKLKEAISRISKEFSPKTIKTSGTLKALKAS